MENRRCIFGGKKAPAGAHLDTPSLESTCFVYLRHKHQDSLFSKNEISYFYKIKGFCHDPTSDFSTRFSDGNMKNSTYVVATRQGRFKLSILPGCGLQVQMGPVIDLICRSEIQENVKLVGRRVAYRSKNIEQINVWDWSGSGLGVLGRSLGIKSAHILIKLIYITF